MYAFDRTPDCAVSRRNAAAADFRMLDFEDVPRRSRVSRARLLATFTRPAPRARRNA